MKIKRSSLHLLGNVINTVMYGASEAIESTFMHVRVEFGGVPLAMVPSHLRAFPGLGNRRAQGSEKIDQRSQGLVTMQFRVQSSRRMCLMCRDADDDNGWGSRFSVSEALRAIARRVESTIDAISTSSSLSPSMNRERFFVEGCRSNKSDSPVELDPTQPCNEKSSRMGK
jgi:hypothetical protein